jgi:hypothetical protein
VSLRWWLSARDLVAVQQRLGPAKPDTTAAMSARTLWHTIYDQHALTAHTSFYRGQTAARAERRSPTCTCPQPDPPPAGPRLDTLSPSEHPAGLGGVSRLPPTPAGDQLWAPTGAGAAAQHHRLSEPPEGSR